MILFRDVFDELVEAAVETARFDVEACGFVLAVDDYGVCLLERENVADEKAIAFRLSPHDIALWKVLEHRGLEIVLFHAHLVGPPHSSSADRRYASPGSRHLIYSIEHAQLALFRFEANDDERIRGRLRPREEPLELVDVRTLPDAAGSL